MQQSAPLAALLSPGDWIHTTAPPADVGDQVVVVAFWTHGCINCVRTVPVLQRWADDLGPRGLMVVGVHTPEFDWEKERASVERFARRTGVYFPTRMDNDSRLWDLFGVRAWPTMIVFDRAGRLRHRFVGEGDFPRRRMLLESLLAEGRNVTSTLKPG